MIHLLLGASCAHSTAHRRRNIHFNRERWRRDSGVCGCCVVLGGGGALWGGGVDITREPVGGVAAPGGRMYFLTLVLFNPTSRRPPCGALHYGVGGPAPAPQPKLQPEIPTPPVADGRTAAVFTERVHLSVLGLICEQKVYERNVRLEKIYILEHK
ncbi:hypothetical protein EYF80_041333 [Liparis tanakae]|uniref:Uncharacterized protein n=1 Tax=Liparis tanakae TaxID=230148 RepID=A0A4Z2G4K5_9TELE|nr:hypothetical protein EYF80_041333 [Liparis tanakae]